MLQHHRASLSKQHIVLVIGMAHKSWLIATGFMTVCCQSGEATMTTHAWTKLGHIAWG